MQLSRTFALVPSRVNNFLRFPLFLYIKSALTQRRRSGALWSSQNSVSPEDILEIEWNFLSGWLQSKLSLLCSFALHLPARLTPLKSPPPPRYERQIPAWMSILSFPRGHKSRIAHSTILVCSSLFCLFVFDKAATDVEWLAMISPGSIEAKS